MEPVATAGAPTLPAWFSPFYPVRGSESWCEFKTSAPHASKVAMALQSLQMTDEDHEMTDEDRDADMAPPALQPAS